MGGLEIFLYILLAIFVAYLSFFFYALSCLISFKDQLNRHLKALSVIYQEKKDLLSALYARMDAGGIYFPGQVKVSCAKAGWLRLNNLKESEIPVVTATLSDLQKRLSLLLGENPTLKEDLEIHRYLGTLHDLDANMRRITALYNAALLGYEYWRKLWAYYPFFFLVGFRKRNRIS